MTSCNSNLNLENIEVIGAGGFGTVYLLKNGLVLKGIRDKKSCGEAKIEFDKQKKIYDSFEKLKKIDIDDDFINLVKKNIVISKPIDSCQNNLTINNDTYSCYILMSKLNGIPIKIYNKLDRESLNKFDKNYLDGKGEKFEIMTQLTFNLETSSGFYGIEYTKTKINNKNPPRGYFITENSDFLNKLRNDYNFKLSDEQLQKIIGFIYGWIFYDTQIVPIDIEIALGLYDNEFKINILDFGLTFDINNYKIENHIRHSSYKNIMNSSISHNEKMKKIIDETRSDISMDIYGDLDNEEMNSGFTYAKKIHNNYFDKNMDGGYYYKKYLKYKNKYLSLK